MDHLMRSNAAAFRSTLSLAERVYCRVHAFCDGSLWLVGWVRRIPWLISMGKVTLGLFRWVTGIPCHISMGGRVTLLYFDG